MNRESGYGRVAAEIAAVQSPAGKTFVVGGTSSVNRQEAAQVFKPDADGTLRFHTTIALALAQCVADRGDTVYVLPGHAEDIAAAAAIAHSVAGVRIVGMGTGRKRPTLTWKTSTAAQITITGANCSFENFIFDFTGISAVVAGFSVTAADVSFIGNEFVMSTGTNAAVLGILTAATAARLIVKGNRFLGPATSTDLITACIKHEVGIDYLIEGNEFVGKMTQAILNATTILGGRIDSNRFVIATGTKAIAMAAASTPFIVNNRINVPSGTAPIVAAAGFVAGNVYSAAAGVTAGTASTI